MRRRKLLYALLTCGLTTGLVAAVGGAPPSVAATQQATVVSENPADFTPDIPAGLGGVDGAVFAFEQNGSTIYAGGQIGTVQNSTRTLTYSRNNFVAFDTSGNILSVAPVFDQPVYEMLRVGTSLYVVGQFTKVNGIAHKGVVKLTLPNLTVDPTFNATAVNGPAFALAMVAGRLIVGGQFTKRLIALNPTTGADTGYINIPITGQVTASTPGKVQDFAVDPAGQHLVAIGHFTSVGGKAMKQAFKLDLGATSATLSPWHSARFNGQCNPRLGMWVRAVDVAPDGKSFVIGSSGGPSTSNTVLCDAVARFEMSDDSTNSKPTWINFTGSDSIYSVADTGAAVYIGGHFRWLDNKQGAKFQAPGAVARAGIGAVDPTTGKALAWNPGKTRGHGAEELWASSTGLWVGSDGTRFNGEYREAIAFCPLS